MTSASNPIQPMFRNYLRVTLRVIRKQKGYAFINVAGLAVGLAFCLLISLYLGHELSYDRMHENADRIYRVHRVVFEHDGGIGETDNYLPGQLGPAMQRDFPEVEQFVRFWERDRFVKSDGDAREEPVLFADSSVFDVFTFPLVRGNPAAALSEPNTVVLTESAAQRYFGDRDPIGRTLSIRVATDYEDFRVVAVAQDVPDNSGIEFEILAPFDNWINANAFFRERIDDWGFSAFVTYVLVGEEARAPSAERLLSFRHQFYPGEVERMKSGEWSEGVVPATYRMQALPGIHLDPTVSAGLKAASDPRYAYVLGGIALAVLLIACINFMTLALGRSTRRAREVGVRKVAGAVRTQLMVQFWTEAMVMSMLALIAGVVLTVLFLPTFSELTGLDLRVGGLSRGAIIAATVAAIVTGLLAGAYPAVVLSGFRPIEVLSNRLKLGGPNAITRALVVVQFGLSIFLLACTLVMLRQMDYLQTASLGYDEEHVIVVPTQGVGTPQFVDRIRSELAARPDVVAVSASTTSFARGGENEGFSYRGEPKVVHTFGVESNYVDLLRLELAEGRIFDPHMPTDSTHAVVVNQALVRDFGWSDPIGQPVLGLNDDPATDPIVVGVLRDYNFRSLESEVEPMLLRLGSPSYRYLLVRIAPSNVPETLDAVRAAWVRTVGDTPFAYSFLDDDLDAQYRDHARWSSIVAYSALFAIFVACLGLLGLAALTVAGRTKEIGIRKVLGATVSQVTVVLSRQFAAFVLVAIVIATPVAVLAMRTWLDAFAFRITLSWYVFAAAGGAALLVALLTVSVQTVRAALADPVRSLRYE